MSLSFDYFDFFLYWIDLLYPSFFLDLVFVQHSIQFIHVKSHPLFSTLPWNLTAWEPMKSAIDKTVAFVIFMFSLSRDLSAISTLYCSNFVCLMRLIGCNLLHLVWCVILSLTEHVQMNQSSQIFSHSFPIMFTLLNHLLCWLIDILGWDFLLLTRGHYLFQFFLIFRRQRYKLSLSWKGLLDRRT